MRAHLYAATPTITAVSEPGCNHMHILMPKPCYQESCIITYDDYLGRKSIWSLIPSCILFMNPSCLDALRIRRTGPALNKQRSYLL